MKRSEKATHQRDMAKGVEFESPKLRREAKADRGHARMTAAEYMQHRMGRGKANVEMVQDRRMRARGYNLREGLAGGVYVKTTKR